MFSYSSYALPREGNPNFPQGTLKYLIIITVAVVKWCHLSHVYTAFDRTERCWKFQSHCQFTATTVLYISFHDSCIRHSQEILIQELLCLSIYKKLFGCKRVAGSVLSVVHIWLFQVCVVPLCVSWVICCPIWRASPSSWRSSQASSKSLAGCCPWLETNSSHLHLWLWSSDNHFEFYMLALYPLTLFVLGDGATFTVCKQTQLCKKWKLWLKWT